MWLIKISGNGKDPGNTLWGNKDDACGTGIGIFYDELYYEKFVNHTGSIKVNIYKH